MNFKRCSRVSTPCNFPLGIALGNDGLVWVNDLYRLFRYDVDRQADSGSEIQVVDGYFAHFVAPEDLPPMAKHVIFVFDTSG